ncbi:Phage integrase family protein [Cognatiyoonia sediminum]|uniref:Phage integrase family protein n=1 Tax=Cognatiyoonia sediminum TaxID=1508389 RepID=A0A1M5MD97_9RHOB|nr:Phage integrase family protein [Cognatiyoonia sediminum]
MAITMTLPYLTRNKGKLVFRRRIPKALTNRFSKTFFETRLLNQETGAAQVEEHTALIAAFDRIVSDALSGEPSAQGDAAIERYIDATRNRLTDRRTQKEVWEDYKVEARNLVRSVHIGGAIVDDELEDEARRLVAEDLERSGADPMLYKAVVLPDAEPPEPTVGDAVKFYEKETVGENPKKSANDTFKRAVRRLEATWGPLDMIPLVDLKRQHARDVRDKLAAEPKYGGGPRSPNSIQREVNSMKSIIETGIVEFDLQTKVSNPFKNLKIEGAVESRGAAKSEWELREPLPYDILKSTRHRILNRTRIIELRHIWRLLQATGCRGAEISGLRVDDVDLEHDVPHVWVRWNDERSIKTKSSIRPIPLLGDGLLAAKEAVEIAGENEYVFARYAKEGGPDNVSGALMRHMREVTKEDVHVVYSLRHNMKQWLGLAEVSEREEDRLLGHTQDAVGNRHYGGLLERLRGTANALEAALGQSPEDIWEV